MYRNELQKLYKKYEDVIIMSNEDNIAPINEDLNVVKIY